MYDSYAFVCFPQNRPLEKKSRENKKEKRRWSEVSRSWSFFIMRWRLELYSPERVRDLKNWDMISRVSVARSIPILVWDLVSARSRDLDNEWSEGEDIYCFPLLEAISTQKITTIRCLCIVRSSMKTRVFTLSPYDIRITRHGLKFIRRNWPMLLSRWALDETIITICGSHPNSGVLMSYFSLYELRSLPSQEQLEHCMRLCLALAECMYR